MWGKPPTRIGKKLESNEVTLCLSSGMFLLSISENSFLTEQNNTHKGTDTTQNIPKGMGSN